MQGKAGKMRFLGFGDNVVDRYLDRGIMYPGGNALNAAVYAARLGAGAAYLGTFGTDAAAGHVQATLARLGIATPHCRVVAGENGRADVRLDGGNRIFVTSNKGGVARLSPFVAGPAVLAYLGGFDLVHSSCFSHLDPQLPQIAAAARLLSYDCSWTWRDSDLLERIGPHVDFVALSAGEGGRAAAEAAIDRAHAAGAAVVLATMGAEGALASAGGARLVQTAAATTVVDTLGAGDAFLTATLLGLVARGWRRELPPTDASLAAALAEAAPFAAAICQLEGAFGEGAPFVGEGAPC
jgi:sugar/nucleoside kinase (ribokinase family)